MAGFVLCETGKTMWSAGIITLKTTLAWIQRLLKKYNKRKLIFLVRAVGLTLQLFTKGEPFKNL